MTGPSTVTLASAPRLETPVPLRRIDWRFLLPRPAGGCFEHMAVLGASPQVVDLLRTAGVAKEVSSALDRATPVDAVILLAGSTHLLDRAADAVAPEGLLYCEVDRARDPGLTLTRLSSRLARAGLETHASYWVIPSFDPALRFIPLDHPGAARWFLRDVYQRPTLSRTAASLLARASTRLGSGPIAAVARCLSVVAVRRSAAETGDMHAPRPALSSSYVPDNSSVALITSGQDDGSRVVLLPFAPSQNAPDRAIKITRHPRYNDRTIGEHLTLGRLHEQVGRILGRSLPTPLTLATRDGLAIASETCAKGATVLVTSGQRVATAEGRVSDLHRTSDWLIAFNRASLLRWITWSEGECRRWLDHPLEIFRQAFGTSDLREQLFARMRSWAAGCEGRSLPLVVTHNDLGPWNVHYNRIDVTVIDWEVEDGSPDGREGLPMTDLVYFTTHWLYAARRLRAGDAELQAFRRLIAPDGHDLFTREARSALVEYAERLGLDRRFIPLLTALTWIERANDRCRRWDGAMARDPVATRYCRYVDMIADRGAAFFPHLSHV